MRPRSAFFCAIRMGGIYEARPTQCRTWPFLPARGYEPARLESRSRQFLPGVGKGKTWTAHEVEVQMTEQKRSEAEYGT